jgi:hypothetical protein
MKIASGETRGNRRPTTPPSRRAGVNQPYTWRGSKIVPPLRGMSFGLGRLPRVSPWAILGPSLREGKTAVERPA